MAVYTTIDDAGSFFNIVLYTGTGSSLAVTGVGFQPDFTWIKAREATTSHINFDAARGVTKAVWIDSTAIEATNVEYLNTFGADGFTVGTNATVNANTEPLVSWNWKGGTTSGITTDGSTTITPSAYSFNQTSGFSALAYTGNSTSGAKLAHGLGVAPEMVIIKNLGTLNDWVSYSKYVKATDPEDWVMRPNNGSIPVDDVTMWNDTQPDSVNITLGNAGNVNTGYSYIAYCFAPVKGFSKIGNYIANGNVDGPFVYTGFKPAFVLIKATVDPTNHWGIYDTKRTPFNPESPLWADVTDTETTIGSTAYIIDLVSNGFKPRTASSQTNSTGYGSPYTYMAFAESPFVNSNGVPTNGR